MKKYYHKILLIMDIIYFFALILMIVSLIDTLVLFLCFGAEGWLLAALIGAFLFSLGVRGFHLMKLHELLIKNQQEAAKHFSSLYKCSGTNLGVMIMAVWCSGIMAYLEMQAHFLSRTNSEPFEMVLMYWALFAFSVGFFIGSIGERMIFSDIHSSKRKTGRKLLLVGSAVKTLSAFVYVIFSLLSGFYHPLSLFTRGKYPIVMTVIILIMIDNALAFVILFTRKKAKSKN